MGLLSGLLGAAAPFVGNLIAPGIGGVIGSALGGAIAGSGGGTQSGTQTTTKKEELDPRIASILFGDGTDANKGLLSDYRAIGQQPQDSRLQQFGNTNLDYLKNAGTDMGQVRDTATALINGTAGNRTGTSAWAVGNMVNAPKQNGIDLSGSYDSFINGAPGANPYLTGAIQKGINQSSNAFGNYLSDAKNATQDVLGGIRSNSVLAGQYGGSRQGIAEGKAIESMNTQLGRAASQFGQNNTDAAVSAQAGAYNTDRDRALQATQGLGAQQYGVAQQNAGTKNAAEFLNVNQVNQANTTNANLAQQGATLGAGLLSGQLGGAVAAGTNQDNYGLNHAAQTNGLLAPYLSLNGSSTTSSPIYQNNGGNILGGAAAGLGLYNQFKGAFGNGGPTYVQSSGSGQNYNFDPGSLSTNGGLLQNLSFLG